MILNLMQLYENYQSLNIFFNMRIFSAPKKLQIVKLISFHKKYYLYTYNITIFNYLLFYNCIRVFLIYKYVIQINFHKKFELFIKFKIR